MFIGFFFYLRARGLKVSVHEWLDVQRALASGLENSSLDGFYSLCRALAVKREAQYDLFDQCFAEYFKGVAQTAPITDELLRWLADAIDRHQLTDEQKRALESLDLDTLRRMFEERLKEQKEQHDGGSHWVGRGGTSPFGHSGYHPSGVSLGQERGSGLAMQVATQRRYRSLRQDQILDTRQFSLALKKLRSLTRDQDHSELDVEASVRETARNLGELELRWRAPRSNSLRLMLLIDVGGSMDVHAALCERLFSAAASLNHFREFRCYAFHNCIYDELVETSGLRREVSTKEVLAGTDSNWYVLVVGDATMHPAELLAVGGRIDYYGYNREPGMTWLKRLKEHYPRSAWLNPTPKEYWQQPSIQLVRQVFSEMVPLSLDGLDEAIFGLLRTRPC